MADFNGIVNNSNETNDFKVNENEMRYALISIAQEITRFQAFTDKNEDSTENNKMLELLHVYKADINFKEREIKKLNKNLKTSCIIAKTLMLAKETESTAMLNHLNIAKDEATELYHKNEVNHKLIQQLTTEKQIAFDKLQMFNEFIELGFQELRKFQSEDTADLTVTEKLKKIITFCSQCHANYTIKHDKCIRLQQSNRYLTNKIHFLENNLERATNEVMNIRFQYLRLQRNRRTKIETAEEKYPTKGNAEFELVYKKKPKQLPTPALIKGKNMATHISIMKKLLFDQFDRLKRLKILLNELNMFSK